MYNGDNELVTIDMHGRLENKRPSEGDFTVNSDREIMNLLEMIAMGITNRIDRGSSMGLFMTDKDGFDKQADLGDKQVEVEVPFNDAGEEQREDVKGKVEEFYRLEPGAMDAVVS